MYHGATMVLVTAYHHIISQQSLVLPRVARHFFFISSLTLLFKYYVIISN